MSDQSVAGNIIANLVQYLRNDLCHEKLSQPCEKRRLEMIGKVDELKVFLSELWLEPEEEEDSEFDENLSGEYQVFPHDTAQVKGGVEQKPARDSSGTYIAPRKESVSVAKSAPNGAPKQKSNAQCEPSTGAVEVNEMYMNHQSTNSDADCNDAYMSMEDRPTKSNLNVLDSKRGKDNASAASDVKTNVIAYSGELMYCQDTTNSAHSAAWKRLRSCAIISGSLQCLKNASSNAPLVNLTLKDCSITRPSGCAQKHVFRIASRSNSNVALLATTSRDSLHTWLQHLLASGAEVQLVGNDKSDESSVTVEEGLRRSISSGLGPTPSGGFKLKKTFMGMFTGRRKDTNPGQTVSGALIRDEAAGVRLSGRLFVCVLPSIDYDEHLCRLYVDNRFEVLDVGVSAGGGAAPIWKESLADGAFELRVLLDCGTMRKGGAMVALRPAGKREDAIVLQADDKSAESTWITQLRLATTRSAPAQIKPNTLPRDVMELNSSPPSQDDPAEAEDLYDCLSENPRLQKLSLFKSNRGEKSKPSKADPSDSERRPELPPRPPDLFPSAANLATPTPASVPVSVPPNTEKQTSGSLSPDQSGPRKQMQPNATPTPSPANVPSEPAVPSTPKLRPKLDEAPPAARRASRAGTAPTGFEIAKHRLDSVQASLREKAALLTSSRAEIVQLRRRETALTEQEIAHRGELQKLISALQAETNKLKAEENELLDQLKKAVVNVALRPTARRIGPNGDPSNPSN